MILFFFLGLFGVFSWTMLWFESRFPVHIFQILYALRWRRNIPGFWPDPSDIKHWLRHEWEDWVSLRFSKPWWAPVGELLTCPVCMAMHITVWATLASLIWDWRLAAAVITIWPGLLITALKHARDT